MGPAMALRLSRFLDGPQLVCRRPDDLIKDEPMPDGVGPTNPVPSNWQGAPPG
jgi:hypothetical protein